MLVKKEVCYYRYNKTWKEFSGMENVLEVKNIEKYYGNKSNLTKAIDNISFNVQKGEFVGIMWASGSREKQHY